jgi:hypothetical protein
MHRLNVCPHTTQQKLRGTCPLCAATAGAEVDHTAALHERLWAGLMNWLVSEMATMIDDATFPDIAESCGFHLVAHKDQGRCRLSAGPRWDVVGHKAGDTCAASQGEQVPADVVADAVELAQVLLQRVRERQRDARLPDPPLRPGGIYPSSDWGAVVLSSSLKGVFDIDLVSEDTGRGTFVGFVKPRSQDVVPNAIRLALAQRDVGRVS